MLYLRMSLAALKLIKPRDFPRLAVGFVMTVLAHALGFSNAMEREFIVKGAIAALK